MKTTTRADRAPSSPFPLPIVVSDRRAEALHWAAWLAADVRLAFDKLTASVQREARR